MKHQHTPSTITLLFKSFRQHSQDKALQPQYLDIVQNHLLSLPFPLLQQQLCDETDRIKKGIAEYLLVCEWWRKRSELLLVIRRQMKAYLNLVQSNRKLKTFRQRQKQLARLLLLLRYYHIQIAELILVIDHKYNIVSKFNYVISFILDQILQLETKNLMNQLFSFLHLNKHSINYDQALLDPFIMQIPQSQNFILNQLSKKNQITKKAEALKCNLNKLKKRLEDKLNKNVNKIDQIWRHNIGRQGYISDQNDFEKIKLKIKSQNREKKHSFSLQSQRIIESYQKQNNKQQEIKHSSSQHTDKLIFKLQKINLQSSNTKQTILFKNSPYHHNLSLQPKKQLSTILLKPIKKEERKYSRPFQKSGGSILRQEKFKKKQSFYQFSQITTQNLIQREEDFQSQQRNEEIDHFSTKLYDQQLNHGPLTYKYKIKNKKYKLYRHKPKKETLQAAQKKYQENDDKIHLIKYRQYIGYNPAIKQPFDIIQTQKYKYTFNPTHKNYQEDQETQTAEPLLYQPQIIFTSNQVQTSKQQASQKVSQNEIHTSHRQIKNEKQFEGDSAQIQIEREMKKKKLQQYVLKLNKKVNDHYSDDQITLQQDCVVEQQQKISNTIHLRSINEQQLQHIQLLASSKINFKDSTSKEFSKIKEEQKYPREILIQKKQGRIIKIILGNYKENQIIKLIIDKVTSQKQKQIFNINKINNWIHKNQTYHAQFTINNKVAVQLLFSPVPNQSLILKLWTVIDSVITTQQSSLLFSNYLQFLSTLYYYNRLIYVGVLFPEIQANSFQKIKDSVYCKNLDISKISSKQKIKRFFNIQIIYIQSKQNINIKSLTEDIFVDKINLQNSGLIKSLDTNLGGLDAALQSLHMQKININKKIEHCMYLKLTTQFKISFVANFPYYYFSDVTLIEVSPNINILRIPITVQQGFIYLTLYNDLKTTIKIIKQYNRSKQYKKVCISMRMFKKNILYKNEQGDVIRIKNIAVWQQQKGILQVKFEKQIIFEDVGCCIFQFSGKIVMGMMIKMEDYLR